MAFPDVGSDAGSGHLASAKPRALRLAAALLLLLCLAWTVPGHAGGNVSVFVLHSYSQEYPWTKRQHEGFLHTLAAAIPDTISASVEYLDTKRVPYTGAYADLVAAHLAQKYAGFEPRFIYVTDDNALLFALTHLTHARLSVRDNGSGMDEATRARIFEPFFTTKPKGKGTGLGLSVVHGIVKAHEASIELESSPGKGSEFRMYFPAIEAPVIEITSPGQDAPRVPGDGKHVLYVDDEEAIIFLMKRLLERQGYRVSGYTDPHEALAAVRANPAQFDLAVTDYNMPGMSGLELAHALREIRADLPVVLASGYVTEELRAEAPAAGVRELIYKPNTVDELCEAVARLAQTVAKKS